LEYCGRQKPGADKGGLCTGAEKTYFPQVADLVAVVCGELVPEAKTNLRGLRGWDEAELARLAL